MHHDLGAEYVNFSMVSNLMRELTGDKEKDSHLLEKIKELTGVDITMGEEEKEECPKGQKMVNGKCVPNFIPDKKKGEENSMGEIKKIMEENTKLKEELKKIEDKKRDELLKGVFGDKINDETKELFSDVEIDKLSKMIEIFNEKKDTKKTGSSRKTMVLSGEGGIKDYFGDNVKLVDL